MLPVLLAPSEDPRVDGGCPFVDVANGVTFPVPKRLISVLLPYQNPIPPTKNKATKPIAICSFFMVKLFNNVLYSITFLNVFFKPVVSPTAGAVRFLPGHIRCAHVPPARRFAIELVAVLLFENPRFSILSSTGKQMFPRPPSCSIPAGAYSLRSCAPSKTLRYRTRRGAPL